MLTTGKGTHYCKHCGFDMKAQEQRECSACDGDLCEPKKRTSVKKAAQAKPRSDTRIPNPRKTKSMEEPRSFDIGASVRVLVGPEAGRIGQVYDVAVPGESKVQLDGDAAGAWWKNDQLEVCKAVVSADRGEAPLGEVAWSSPAETTPHANMGERSAVGSRGEGPHLDPRIAVLRDKLKIARLALISVSREVDRVLEESVDESDWIDPPTNDPCPVYDGTPESLLARFCAALGWPLSPWEDAVLEVRALRRHIDEHIQTHSEDLATILNLRANIRDLQAQLTTNAQVKSGTRPDDRDEKGRLP